MNKIKKISFTFLSIIMLLCACGPSKIKVHVKDTTPDPNYEYIVEVISGSTLPKLEQPSITGYDFKGWIFNGKLWEPETKIDSEIAIHASWEPQTYKIVYIVPEGTINDFANPSTYSYKEEVPLYPPLYMPAGYTFVKWLDENDKEITAIPSGSMGHRKITADYTKK